VEGHGWIGGLVNIYRGELGQLKAYVEPTLPISNPAIVNNAMKSAITTANKNILFFKVSLFLCINDIIIHNTAFSY
jgi:hypothetical protein